MHQGSPKGSNFSSSSKHSQNLPATRYALDSTNIVNIQHATTSRCTLASRSTVAYGCVSQTTMSPSVLSSVTPLKTPFSVVKGGVHTTMSPLAPTIPHFGSPNKKITIPNIVKPPPTQKVKVEVKEEIVEEDPSLLRERILQTYFDSVEEIKCNFKEKLQELFFVQSGGNMVDYPAWKQRPNPHLLSFLNIYRLDDTTTLSTPTATNTVSPSIKMQAAYSNPAGSGNMSQLASPYTGTPSQTYSSYSEVSKNLPQTVTTTVAQYGFVQTSLASSSKKTCSSASSVSCSTVSATPIKLEPPSISETIEVSSTDCKPIDTSRCTISTPPQPHFTQSSSNTTPNPPSSSQDDIYGQVRHESDIQQRISLLRKSGLWSASRLPKVYEAPRKKSQWDFLLEEMQWLAADFTQEKKWKRSMAKKVSRSVMKFHQDKAAFQKKLKREENARLKRIAGGIAKEVKQFWRQIEKVACYKQQSRQEEQRRKALDLHLNFIVGQTEKYSSWLAEGMKDASAVSSTQVSDGDDDEFEPDIKNAEDDESTIAEEESLADGDGKKEDRYQQELEALKEESEIPMEDLLKTLPSDMLARIAGTDCDGDTLQVSHPADNEEMEECFKSEAKVTEPEAVSDEKENEETEAEKEEMTVDDEDDVEENNDESGDEYVANQEEMEDDENTIEEEEEMGGEVDHQAELDELQNEADMPIEELRKMYGVTGTGHVETGNDSDDSDDEEGDDATDDDSGTEYESESEESVSESESEVSGKTKEQEKEETTTADDEGTTTANKKEDGDKGEKSLYSNQQLTDAAAAAESLQPKGTTLSTQQVKTKVPFLLRHTLREYQHIGLDWLVTMYQKQLNGILADEMGLGKTIQTIALLAHLACEEEIWGPHLIVVPTSVILNWEFEFKKWCPGFKILSYFGNQKERKLKRTGWMKPNAFHVCITSYNLVIQDHQAFRRRKWKYLILDEAQNIKNFKSQRWQMLLNFNSQRRLLLTGTPLQNHLMELWSLMHFLMPNIFNSHQDFKEWFANPLTGMVEGNTEYNEELIKRLHTVLRPFLLRRLKAEVELQMPKKYEHVVKCRLSKRQRFLYDEFMSRTKTKETLEAGNFLSVINILMQLRKVCNHPDLFELRPTISPYIMDKITYNLPSLINDSLPDQQPPFGHCLATYELTMCAFQAHRTRQLKVHKSLLHNLRDGLENELLAKHRSSSPSDSSSSSFRPLSNITSEYGSVGGNAMEAERSYFDCLTPSIASMGNYTIGDILTRQIQQSLEADIVVDVEGSETATDGDKTTCPAAKKPRLNHNNSNRNSLSSINSSNLNNNRQSPFTPGNENTTGSETCDGLDSDDDDGESKEEPTCNCPDVSNHSCGRGRGPGDGSGVAVGSSKSNRINRIKKRNKTRSGLLLGDYVADEVSPFHLPSLKDANEEQTNSRCSYMAETNERHCEAAPVYGLDLHRAVQVSRGADTRIVGAMMHQVCRQYFSSVLEEAIKTPADRLVERKNITDRFLLYVYPLLSQDVAMKVAHSVPWRDTRFKQLQTELNSKVRPKFNILAPMVTHSRLQFPETRLVQYDCGKLQTLDLLLRQLKADKHRALIFTQMSRMLDVLERFLNYHGFIYLRLDGSTKVDQRQVLMERFNKDEKIFCFILSTRSGGMGVNLTGADTVIFYDSDWNPTMDAQAQDRCHRIGQTRDVHIYRLISDKTVEENILKKAQNKRILGNIAIEGGNFTAAYFKQTSLKELFDTSSSDDQPSTSQQPISSKTSSESVDPAEEDGKDAMKSTEYEEVLAKVEEEDDAKAAERAKIEQDCELAEFNDNVPENAGGDESKVEKALAHLESELKPIERFALKFMELTQSFHVEDEVEETEKMLALKKKEWELDHLQSMKEEEEKKHLQEDDEMFYTYARDETYTKVSPNKKDGKSRKKSRKKTVEEEVVEEEEEEDDKEVHNRIKPLIMQLGADRIAEIKKVAQEAIQAKTIQSSSDLVKMRVRKKPEFFNSGCSTPEPGSQPTEYLSASPSPPVTSTSTASRTNSPDPNNLQSGLDLVKMRVRKKAEFFDAGSCTPTSPPPRPFLPHSPTPASKKLKMNQKAKLALEKAKTGSLKTNRGGIIKGGSQGPSKHTKQNTKSIISPTNKTHQIHSGKPLNKPKNAQRQPKTGAAKIHPLPKSNCAVKLKDYVPKPPSNDSRHSSTENLDADHSVNGIIPFADNNNIPHDSLSQWNGIMSGGPFTSVPSFHTSYPTQNNAPSVVGKAPLNNTADHLHRYLSSANDHIGGYSNPTTNFHHHHNNAATPVANSHLLPTKALHLSQLSSTASSPLHSPASSSDSGGDVRRSSRTPRPKTYDNNDWFLFS